MKRYPCIVTTVAIFVLALVVLLSRGVVPTSQAQAAYVQELEARLTALEAAAGVPAVIAYQGYLTDAGGTPLNGEYTLDFSIHTAEVAGDQAWAETHTNVPVHDGYFSVLLGQENVTVPLTEVFDESERWVEVRVGGVSGMSLPRQPIAAVPYALSVPALGCRVTANISQTIPHAEITPLVFDTEINNMGHCWSSDEPTRLVAPVSGYYMAGGAVGFFKDQLVPGRIAVGIRLTRQDGTFFIQMNEVHTDGDQDAVPSVATGMFYMSAGDYIEVWAFQDLESAGPIETVVVDDPVLYQHLVNGWLVKVGN